ncbi:hypothetical protein JYU34_002326 [Plutella xylostella]|uniref:HSF-type DNA-binding domain-containing protein n=2 Tax=Plutella xylostella TaxID=51655 RepID=A0ABQ7R224_PLUXY|nr:hypothetical protein JYU34_002326 [Plutella xylostella]
MQDEANAMFQMRFPQKLWYLLNLRTDAILWGGTGRTILLNYRILHSYLQCDHSIFKTTNISSFVRQLNLYGFRKVTSHSQDPLCNSSNPYMHEYAHDYFQFGRPELLNKINRKAITIKKNFKQKSVYTNEELFPYMTPLQKARQTLRVALQKAARDLYSQASPKSVNCEGTPENHHEKDESFYLDWFNPKSNDTDKQFPQPEPVTDAEKEETQIVPRNVKFGMKSEEILINFTDESNQQNNESDSFTGQFLSMPELDSVPVEDHGADLLAQYTINVEQDKGIARSILQKCDSTDDAHNALNCLLPSISIDQNDDVSMVERGTGLSGHYHGEWDQMFNDIITSKGASQECGSELKELYSQISKTIDLLNS